MTETDDLFDDLPDDPFADLFGGDTQNAVDELGQATLAKAEDLQELMDTKYGRGNNRVFTVKLGYNTHGLQEGQMIMEVVSMRDTIPSDWGVQKWREFMDTVGAAPFRVLFSDIDRYHMALFGAEYLRCFETKEDRQAHGQWRANNPDWDPNAENVEQDGRTLGGVDDDPLTPPVISVKGDAGVSHALGQNATPVLPVREQIDEQKKFKLALNKSKSLMAKTDAGRRPEDDPQMRIWEIAIGLARKPRAEWQDKVDWMLEQKVKYCYSWIKETGEVPRPYPEDMLNLFWPKPYVGMEHKDVTARRNDIVGKVMDYWRKSVDKNGTGIELESTSYRVTMAAMELEKAIEAYVKAGAKFNMQGENTDKAEELGVRQAATKYFQAHFPITMHGAGPGPLSTMDPDYVEYRRLCSQYSIPVGTLLHEHKF